MFLLIGAWTIGLILGLLALGIFISFRVFDFADMTGDGSITLGAALAATLIVSGTHPVAATAAAFAAGAAAGLTTALVHTKCGVNRLLSGILVMTALYSVNLHVMGKANVPLLSAPTLTTMASRGGRWGLGADVVNVGGWLVDVGDVSMLVFALATVTLAAALVFAFFRTNLGTAMQASGDNARMIRALGVNVEHMLVIGLALSNGLIALGGALLAQYQGFADVQMGIGMVVWGLASVIIGESLVGTRRIGLLVAGAVMGSVLFRLLVAIALRGGLNPNDLKLITAAFVLAALVSPRLLSRVRRRVPLGEPAP